MKNINFGQYAIILLLIILFGCLMTDSNKINQNENGNFVLYVSNQNFVIDPVDIKIYIDGKLAVDQEFEVLDAHNWLEFKFNLSKGKHTLKAESIKGDVILTKEFEIIDKHWAVIDYWYYPEGHKMTIGDPVEKKFHF